MSIYDASGTALYSAYQKNGEALSVAYDKNGNVIFTAAPPSLKVMTYNCGGWYDGSGSVVPDEKVEQYIALQTGMIQNNDPDVLCIQEYIATIGSTQSALTLLQSLFPYVIAKPNSVYWGRAICSKYPISDYTVRLYENQTRRYYDSCTVTVGGVPITFVNTHLDTTQANRTAEIQELVPFLGTLDRFILCGDFNTGIHTDTKSTSSTEYINNVKPFVDAGFETVNFGGFGWFITCNTDGYLDNIYTSDNITIDDAYVDQTKKEDLLTDTVDHMPLIAELTLDES